MSPDEYRAHIAAESARFSAVLAESDPSARVPHCPEWDAYDLAHHLTDVQAFWAFVLEHRPAAPDDYEERGRAASYAAQLSEFDAASAALQAALADVTPTESAWTWAPEQTTGFIVRRQALEALVHRIDAEQAAGVKSEIDPLLAADGVDEVLDVMYGGKPDWGTFTPTDHLLRVDLTDVDISVWVRMGHFHGTDPEGVTHDQDDIEVIQPSDVAEPDSAPDTVINGEAGSVLSWLWRRSDDEQIHVAGDRDLYDRFRAAVRHPIN